VTDTARTEKPKRDTASAFACQPSRDFDGGLLERHTFTLIRADALAYLRLKRGLPGWARWALGAWFVLGGMVWGLLPDWIIGAEGSWQGLGSFLAIIGLQFGALLLGREVWRHWRARQMVPTPRLGEYEEWIDCVAGSEIGSEDCAYLSPELIGEIVDGPNHIFVLNHNTRIVIPKRAFESPAMAQATVDHLRELAAGPYYFDPQD
jgi:hypothetical protein